MAGEDFDTWIEPMRPVEYGDGILEISVPNRMFAAWVQDNYLDELTRAWVNAAGRKTRFEFTWGQIPSQ